MQQKLKICDNCKKPSIIWKSSGTGGKRYCKQCSSNTGVAKLSIIKPTAKAKPIPPRSQKRSKEERLYQAKRIIFLQEHPLCEAHLPGICTKHATDVHHSYSGKDRQQHFLNESTWFATCRACHDWIHNHSKEARELGYLK